MTSTKRPPCDPWRSRLRPKPEQCVAIVIACLFFLGINTVSTKLADPHGHDLDDLRILSHCKLMPGACKSIMDFDGRAPRRDAGEPPDRHLTFS